MRVLLAGATGTLGTVLVARLKEAGHEVIGLTRGHSGADALASAGVEPVIADVLQREQLLGAVSRLRADAVVHEATALTRTPMFHRDLAATDRLRDIGTANLIRAADAVGATRFLTQSFFLGYGWSDHGVAPLREDNPFADPSTGPFEPHLRSLRSNEHQVRSIGGIALRYGMFYGPERTTRAMMTDLRRRRLPAPKHPGVLHPIHIDDAATATVAALSLGSAGEAYNIGDDCPVDMGVYLDALADAAGARHPVRLPNWALRATPYLYALLVTSRIRMDTSKARDELQWTPAHPSYREGFASLTPG